MPPPAAIAGSRAISLKKRLGTGDVWRNAMIASLVSRRGSLPQSVITTPSPANPFRTQGLHTVSRTSKQSAATPLGVSPGIPWPTSPDVVTNLEAQARWAAAGGKVSSTVAATSSSAGTAAAAAAAPTSGSSESDSGTTAGSVGSSGSEYSGFLPAAISAMCLMVLLSTFTTPVIGSEPVHVVVEEVESDDSINLSAKNTQSDQTDARARRREMMEHLSQERIDKVFGLTLAALKLTVSALGIQSSNDEWEFEKDVELQKVLNQTIPSLITTLQEVEHQSDIEIAENEHDFADDDSETGSETQDIGTVSIAGKSVIANTLDLIRASSQAVVMLVSQWLSAASIVSMVLPVSVRQELEFLGHYLSYCVETETALNLPYMFPSDFETDRTGAIIKINSPMSIFMLRALARTAAGVAVSLLPFFRKRTTLRKPRQMPRPRSFQALNDSNRLADLPELPEVVSVPPKAIRARSTSSSSRPPFEFTLSNISPPSSTPSSPLRRPSSHNKLDQHLSDYRLSSSSPKEIPLQKVSDRHLDVAATLRKMNLDSRSLVRDIYSRSVGSEIDSRLLSRSFGSEVEARLSSSPIGEEWESFRVREAGIPLEILKLEFEAIRAGSNPESSLFMGEMNNLDAW
ncbi:hypothetical protein HDU97_006679 [Phlyctochytrium planicorne]|nr:hypothetical protein HDU97_006679 [Phlyctochytrium planicorne]